MADDLAGDVGDRVAWIAKPTPEATPPVSGLSAAQRLYADDLPGEVYQRAAVIGALV